MNKISLLDNVLESAQWVEKTAKDVVRAPGKRPKVVDPDSWRDQFVEHTTPSGQVRRVKIKTLDIEEQQKYKPDNDGSDTSNKNNDVSKKERLKKKVEKLDSEGKKRDVQKGLDDKDKDVDEDALDKEKLAEILERAQNKIKKLKYVDSISFEEIRSILATEYMKAGAPLEKVQELFKGTSGDFKSKESYINNQYVLLPVNGDFKQIRKRCLEVFNE